MSPPSLFLDGEGGLDIDQIVAESIPIAYLIAAFGAVALVPFLLGFLLGPGSVGLLFVVLGQFVLAVGTAVVLLYVVTRALQLHEALSSAGD